MVLGPVKGTYVRETASFDVLCIKIGAAVLAVDVTQEHPTLTPSLPKKPTLSQMGSKSRMRKTAYSIWMKFCVLVEIPDVITYENCGDDRSMGLRWQESFLLFCLYIRRRPYKHFTTTAVSVDASDLLNCSCMD